MPQLSNLLQTFEDLWPSSGAADWDSPGLTVGRLDQNVSKVFLSVDVTAEVVEIATEWGADLLLSHHPFIMRGVKTLAENTAKGALLSGAIRSNLALFSAHTNADIVTDGVSDVIAKLLQLTDARPLDSNSGVGTGRIGLLPEAIELGELARTLARILPQTASGIRVAGDYRQVVERVALCGGAGDSLLPTVQALGADVYITSDLRHHVVQDVREQARITGAPALIDVSHWASEFLWLEVAAEQLRRIHSDVVFEVCDLRTDPWDFVVTQ